MRSVEGVSTSPRHAPVQFSAPDFAVIERDMARFKAADLAPRTVSSYESDVRVFRAWCLVAQRVSLPATAITLQLYVTDLIGSRGRKISTVERHVAAIKRLHKTAGEQTPCGPELQELLAGARRILCQRPLQKEAIRVVDLKAMLRAIGRQTPTACRNAAVLLFGYASALRRSNLAFLRFEDLTFQPKGILVVVAREKQEREGKVRMVAVPRTGHSTCPVGAVERWLTWRGRNPGFLFQGVLNGKVTGRGILPNRVCQIVQEAVAAVDLDPRRFGAHSLRSGMASEALENNVNEVMVARQLGHSSLETTRIYLRSRDLFRGNPAGMIGL